MITSNSGFVSTYSECVCLHKKMWIDLLPHPPYSLDVTLGKWYFFAYMTKTSPRNKMYDQMMRSLVDTNHCMKEANVGCVDEMNKIKLCEKCLFFYLILGHTKWLVTIKKVIQYSITVGLTQWTNYLVIIY